MYPRKSPHAYSTLQVTEQEAIVGQFYLLKFPHGEYKILVIKGRKHQR